MHWSQSSTFQVPLPLQLLYFFFVKAVGFIILYTFINQILVQDDSMIFKVIFLTLLILERFTSLQTLITIAQPSIALSTLMIMVSPLYIEEIALLFNADRLKYFINKGINSQVAFNNLESSPLYIMMIIKAFKSSPQNLETFIPGVLALLAFTIVFICINYTSLIDALIYSDKNFTPNSTIQNNQSGMLNHFKEGIFSFIHFFSYASLLWLGINTTTNFNLYFLASHIILGYRLITCIHRNENKLQRLFPKTITQRSIFFEISALLQIQFDVTRLTNSLYCPSAKKYGKYVFDQLSEYAFWLKLSLLVGFVFSNYSSHFQRDISGRTEYLPFVLWVISINGISLILLAFRYYQYVVSPYLFGPVVIEIFSTKQLSMLFEQYTRTKCTPQSNFKRLKKLVWENYEPQLVDDANKQGMLSSLLSGFEGAEIEFSQINTRRRTSNGLMEVTVSKQISSIENIIKSIEDAGILPEIDEIQLLDSYCDCLPLVKILIEKKQRIKIKLPYSHLNQSISVLIQFVNHQLSTIYSIHLFERLIQFRQSINPAYICYDLFEPII